MRLTDEQRDEYTQGRLQEIEAENRRLRERLNRPESGLRALIEELGGNNHAEDMRHM